MKIWRAELRSFENMSKESLVHRQGEAGAARRYPEQNGRKGATKLSGGADKIRPWERGEPTTS